MKIISGRSHPALAQEIAKLLHIPYVETIIEAFDDQELRVQITEPLYEDDVVIVQSTSRPANDHLMELLLLVDAARRAGSKRIIALIPYFGYSRQDRPSYEFGPISASLVATLLEAAGVSHLITMDLHSRQLEGFFKIGVQNIDSIHLFGPYLTNLNKTVIISPDVGGLIRARRFSETYQLDLAVMNKSRDHTRKCHISEVMGDVQGKHCIIVDDIVDTAGTLCKAGELLHKQGALSVQTFVTHGVLSGQAMDRLEKSPIEKILLSDTIVHSHLSQKFQILSTAPLLAEALAKLEKTQKN